MYNSRKRVKKIFVQRLTDPLEFGSWTWLDVVYGAAAWVLFLVKSTGFSYTKSWLANFESHSKLSKTKLLLYSAQNHKIKPKTYSLL